MSYKLIPVFVRWNSMISDKDKIYWLTFTLLDGITHFKMRNR